MINNKEYIVVLGEDLAQKIYADQPEFDRLANEIRAGEMIELPLAKGGVLGVPRGGTSDDDLVTDLFLPDEKYQGSASKEK